ncbi:hypothetical protein L7F22_024643 [Adiantum nelumboides]|nr:hypothetical protein [Adiantum nelumboides]
MDQIEDKLDNITNVLSLLNSPKDLANAACVCYTWQKCVIEGELRRKLCIKFFPEIGRVCQSLTGGGTLENPYQTQQVTYVGAKSCPHGILLKNLLSPPLQRTCISEPLHASSTDNLPEESIAQTLYPEPFYRDHMIPSCWSSQGEVSRDVPENLTYRLVSDLCVIHSIKIQPYLGT